MHHAASLSTFVSWQLNTTIIMSSGMPLLEYPIVVPRPVRPAPSIDAACSDTHSEVKLGDDADARSYGPRS